MSVAASEISSKVQEAFNFTVDKFPLSGPDGLRTSWFGLFRSDTCETVGNGSVTNRYVPHQTDDVLSLVDAASEAFDGEIDVRCHFRDGHFVAITPSKEQRRAVFGTADNVFPRVIISAGYDGKAFKATMGYYRDVCKNMSIMRQVNGTTVSIRHTSGLRSAMDDLVKTFELVKRSWVTLADVITSLESRRVQMPEFLNAVYGEPNSESGRGLTVHRKRTEAIFRRLHSERLRTGREPMDSTFTVSAWEAYNAVQGYVQHDAQAKTGFKGEFDRILRAANDHAVMKAESLALGLIAV